VLCKGALDMNDNAVGVRSNATGWFVIDLIIPNETDGGSGELEGCRPISADENPLHCIMSAIDYPRSVAEPMFTMLHRVVVLYGFQNLTCHHNCDFNCLKNRIADEVRPSCRYSVCLRETRTKKKKNRRNRHSDDAAGAS
jgi:hypothetical protein